MAGVIGVVVIPAPAAADFGAASTSYCLSGTMANGRSVHWGAVASNRHPLGTRIQLTGRTFFGMRRFVVEDRIGWGSELDFWASSCSTSFAWGRRYVTYRLGWRHKRGRVVRVHKVLKVLPQ